jgi:hypothetical protein
MEIAQQMTHREQQEAEAQKEALKLNLKEQVYDNAFYSLIGPGWMSG